MVEEVYISNQDYVPILESQWQGCKLILITPQEMHQVSQMSTPPGVLTICSLPHPQHLPENLNGLKIFYLDAVRDPGNLGTILRIADWFGLDFVIFSPDSVDVYNHKVLQSSMGSALRVRTTTLEASALLSWPGATLYVCDADGKNINTLAPPDSGIIVFGNESLGVSTDLMHQVKDMLAIPGDHSLGAESLNVASAAAIVAAWWRK